MQHLTPRRCELTWKPHARPSMRFTVPPLPDSTREEVATIQFSKTDEPIDREPLLIIRGRSRCQPSGDPVLWAGVDLRTTARRRQNLPGTAVDLKWGAAGRRISHDMPGAFPPRREARPPFPRRSSPEGARSRYRTIDPHPALRDQSSRLTVRLRQPASASADSEATTSPPIGSPACHSPTSSGGSSPLREPLVETRSPPPSAASGPWNFGRPAARRGSPLRRAGAGHRSRDRAALRPPRRARAGRTSAA